MKTWMGDANSRGCYLPLEGRPSKPALQVGKLVTRAHVTGGNRQGESLKRHNSRCKMGQNAPRKQANTSCYVKDKGILDLDKHNYPKPTKSLDNYPDNRRCRLQLALWATGANGPQWQAADTRRQHQTPTSPKIHLQNNNHPAPWRTYPTGSRSYLVGIAFDGFLTARNCEVKK